MKDAQRCNCTQRFMLQKKLLALIQNVSYPHESQMNSQTSVYAGIQKIQVSNVCLIVYWRFAVFCCFLKAAFRGGIVFLDRIGHKAVLYWRPPPPHFQCFLPSPFLISNFSTLFALLSGLFQLKSGNFLTLKEDCFPNKPHLKAVPQC